MNVVTFCLSAHIGSMGGPAYGSNRTGWNRPAKSAVLGLIAAALGIPRSAEREIMALQRDVGMAMLVDHVGDPFVDFQTVMKPSFSKNSDKWRTRADELAAIKPSDNAVVVHKDYFCDIVVLFAVWIKNPGEFSLDQISAALKSPFYHLYFGRKACPLSLPPCPEFYDGSVIDALKHRHANGIEREFAKRQRTNFVPYITMDKADVPVETSISWIDYRSDRLLSRGRWAFHPREEAIIRQF